MTTFSLRMPRLHSRAGFGLVELMVSIGIMVLVMSVVIVNHNSFSRGSLLRSQAYEIALRLREVQLLAVSARVGEADARLRYGTTFLMATPNRFQVFGMPETANEEDYAGYLVGAPGTLDNRFTVTRISTIDSSGTESSGTKDGMIIIFERPNFDATFFDPSGSEYSSITAVRLYVDSVRSPGTPRKVVVTRAGQISVE